MTSSQASASDTARRVAVDATLLPQVDIIALAHERKILRAERRDEVDMPAFIIASAWDVLCDRFGSQGTMVIAGLEKAVEQMRNQIARHCVETGAPVAAFYEFPADLFEDAGMVEIRLVVDRTTGVACMCLGRAGDFAGGGLDAAGFHDG